MRKDILLIFSAGLLLLGCGRQSPRQEISEYYDIEGLFLSQPSVLESQPFNKSAVIDQKSETAIVKFDTSEWKKELAMFVGLDINKAALVGVYEKETDEFDGGKNLTYTLKPGEESGIKMIRIRQDAEGNVTELEALFNEKNLLYQNRRELIARFEIENELSVLKSYRIKGYQKIILKDTVNYTVEAVSTSKGS